MANLITLLAILLSGYSLFSALLIAITHFRCTAYKGEKTASQWTGLILLSLLAILQWYHFSYLNQHTENIHTTLYRMLLFSIAPTFYLFSRPLLSAQIDWQPSYFLHLIPIGIAPWVEFNYALGLAFLVGSGYLIWLARSIYALRAQRNRFKLELGILSIVFMIALLVTVLALFLPYITQPLFFSLYTSAIGMAFFLVNLVLTIAPQLPYEVTEAARETYASSTLSNVDCDQMIEQLESLLKDNGLYKEPELDLPSLARELALTSHQLSELINSRLGKGFSRYIREYRVEAAKAMLIHEPSASVLSVGLTVGFTSQSNFYEAFREITGMTPGNYRKLNLKNFK